MTERKPSRAAILRAERQAQRREAAESFLDNDLPDQIRSLRRLVMMVLTNQMSQLAVLQELIKDQPECVALLEGSYERTERIVTEELRT